MGETANRRTTQGPDRPLVLDLHTIVFLLPNNLRISNGMRVRFGYMGVFPFLVSIGCGGVDIIKVEATPTPPPVDAQFVEQPACTLPSMQEVDEVAVGSDPLLELSELGAVVAADSPDGGGSIRAKIEPDPQRLAGRNHPCRLRAKVEKVVRGRFPLVAVRVSVVESAPQGPGSTLDNNDVIVILPRLTIADGAPVMADPVTRTNAAAFFFDVGDRIGIWLGAKTDGKWQADLIERE